MQYVALASSQLHFTDTFDAGFKKKKKTKQQHQKNSISLSPPALLRLQSLSVSLLNLISSTPTGILFTWAFFYINMMSLSLTYTHELHCIPQGHFTTNKKRNKATLAFNDGHETHLINSYDAGLR